MATVVPAPFLAPVAVEASVESPIPLTRREVWACYFGDRSRIEELRAYAECVMKHDPETFKAVCRRMAVRVGLAPDRIEEFMYEEIGYILSDVQSAPRDMLAAFDHTVRAGGFTQDAVRVAALFLLFDTNAGPSYFGRDDFLGLFEPE